MASRPGLTALRVRLGLRLNSISAMLGNKYTRPGLTRSVMHHTTRSDTANRGGGAS